MLSPYLLLQLFFLDITVELEKADVWIRMSIQGGRHARIEKNKNKLGLNKFHAIKEIMTV